LVNSLSKLFIRKNVFHQVLPTKFGNTLSAINHKTHQFVTSWSILYYNMMNAKTYIIFMYY